MVRKRPWVSVDLPKVDRADGATLTALEHQRELVRSRLRRLWSGIRQREQVGELVQDGCAALGEQDVAVAGARTGPDQDRCVDWRIASVAAAQVPPVSASAATTSVAVERASMDDGCGSMRRGAGRRRFVVELDAEPNAMGCYQRMGVVRVGVTASPVVFGRELPRMSVSLEG